MREFTVVAWCDACPGASRKTSVQTYTVGITEGEERPALHIVDLCDEHAAMMSAVAKLIVGAPHFTAGPGRPKLTATTPAASIVIKTVVPKPTPPAIEPPSVPDTSPRSSPQVEPKREIEVELDPLRRPSDPRQPVKCPVCSEVISQGSLVTHVWSRHRPERRRPLIGNQCPECGYVNDNPRVLGFHRHNQHGYNALADALSGVPGYGATEVVAPKPVVAEPETPRVPTEASRRKSSGKWRKVPMDYCPLCGKEMLRSTLTGHVWMVHRRGEDRPPSPTTCPECGWHSHKKEQVGIHRYLKHGYDSLADALAGVKMPSS